MGLIYYLQNSDLNESSAVLRVTGPDANTYLQGQFTQDVRISPGMGVYGLWLDHKGKVQADSQVFKRAENDFWVVAFGVAAGMLRARLESYLVADEVELEDATAQWESLLLWGPGAAELIPPPDVLTWASRRADKHGKEWLVPTGRMDEALSCAPAATQSSAAAAELERLQAGFPKVPVDVGPRDLPQEGALEFAVSYTKGCYLGQEVMARLKNLGQVRRGLHLVAGAGSPPAAGSALHQAGRKVGEMRSAIAEGSGFVGLAMLSMVQLDTQAPLSATPEGREGLRIIRHV